MKRILTLFLALFSIYSISAQFNCKEAIPISCGQSIDDDNKNFCQNTVSGGYCGSNDFRYTGREKLYTFEITEDQSVRIELSGLKADLDMFLLRSCSPQDCIAKSTNSRTKSFELISTSLSPGTYYIAVDGWAWASSTFTLKLSCVDDDGMLDCNNVIPISCGNSITGNTSSASNNNDGPYCNKYSNYGGPEQIFEFSLDIKSKVSIIASELTGDLDMFLLDTCLRNRCVSASGKGGTNTESLTKTLLPGTYYIVLDGYQDATSNYKLSLHCQAIEEIDCNTAISTYYSGNGSNLQFAHKFNGGINADFQYWSIGNRIISRSPNVHLVFQQAGTFNVCATYVDKSTGQTVKCCKTTCISLPTTCEDAIQYEYVDGHFELSLDLGDIDTPTVVWRNDTDGLEIDPNNVPASCRKILVSVRYYDNASECWILCCKYITFCPPSSCQDDITATYDPTNRKYTFNFNNPAASNILWRFDDSKEIIQNGMYVLPDDWTCQDKLVTIYYYDTIEKSWKVCCKTIHLCPPVKCDDAINYDYDLNTNTFKFSLDQSDATNVDWRFVETDQALENGAFTIPADWQCQALTVEASYFDPASQSWNICTRIIEICPPDECSEAISFDYDATNNQFIFNLNIDGAEHLFWRIDEDKVWLSDGSFQLPAGWQCQEKTITVFYFDSVEQVWKVCCKRIYLCPPDDCEDAIDYTYDAGDNSFQFSLSFNSSDVSWFFEESGATIPNGKFVIPNDWTCQILTVRAFYYDADTDCYRLCTKKVNICPAENCEEAINYKYDAANNAFVFTLELDGITETAWKFEDDDSAIPGGVFVLPDDWVCMNKTVSVFYFDPAEDCWKLCSRRITICPPNDCQDNINYEYLPDENAFQFSLDIAGATETFWKFENADYIVPNGKFVLPDNWTCTDLTISVFYFNTETDCWVICSKDVHICPPTDCSENVLYSYDEVANAFIFDLDIDGVDEVLWIFDDSKDPIQDGEFIIPDDWVCQVKLVSAYYFDTSTSTWKVCCRPIFICPPTDCKESIDFYFDESGNNVIFEFTDAADIQGFSWQIKESGVFLGNNPMASTELAIPDSCQEVTIVARYEIEAVWYYCEKRVYLCNPNECEGVIMSAFNDNTLTLTVDDALTEVNWFDSEGNFLGSGNEINLEVVSEGVISVMVFFRDERTDCYASCNEDIEITCTLPNASFTYTMVGVGFQFTNTSDTGTTFEWDFDEGLIVDTSDMPTVIFPTGTHDVCIRVTNDCGEKLYCEQLVVNNKSTVTFDMPDNLCGNAGDILNVPVSVTNFKDILSFKFTIRSTDEQKARIMGIKVEDEIINNGHNYHTEDDQVRFFWSNANGQTLTDASQVFNIQVELMEETANPIIFEFTDDPVAAEAFNSNMDIIPLLFQTGSVCAESKPLFADVSGSIVRPGNNDPLNLAQVDAEGVGGTGDMSATDGSYRISPLNIGEDYTIVPFKNDDITNGINALDILLIQRHILKVNEFDSPFTFIAADINNDQLINALDVVNLQRLQLRLIDAFPNNTSWRFVPTDYTFQNDNPLMEGFPEDRLISNLDDNKSDEDFYAIKIGDIDYSADALGATARSNSDDTLQLSLGSVYAERNEMVRVPVMVSNFTEIAAIEGSIQWNGDKLSFLGADDYNVEGLTDDNFALPEANANTLTFNWINASLPGTTLEDEHILFYLNFESEANTGELAIVEFLDEPLALFAANADLEEVEVEAANSDIAFIDPLQINSSTEDNNCFGSNQGKISLSVTGGTGNYSYNWNTGAATPILEGLDAGEYSCTITDVFSGKTELVALTIESPDELNISFETDSTSFAQVIVQGGTLPYNFEWSNGNTSSEIANLEPGSYEVTIVDANGCSIRGEVTIIEEVVVSIQDEPLLQLELRDIIIAPNPSTHYFDVVFNTVAEQDIRVQVYNTNGQLVKQSILSVGQDKLRIETDQLTDGLYYVKAFDGISRPKAVIVAH